MKEFDELVSIIARLRDSQNGCPWDIKQTHESLIPNFIEELYETIEAIEMKDFSHLCEELGDLMLHVVMQAQIASEANHFDMKDILKKINEKLIRRHPHVFGETKIEDSESVKMNWERIKFEEKKASRKSAIDGIPQAMPALIIAQRMQEKAASVGFDWPDVKPTIEKMKEEINEFQMAFETKNSEEMQNELGDMLFSIVNIARKLGFDSESALKRTIRKFDKRFRIVEEHFQNQDRNMLEAGLESLDEIWENAKKDE
jgi:MazG family protein